LPGSGGCQHSCSHRDIGQPSANDVYFALTHLKDIGAPTEWRHLMNRLLVILTSIVLAMLVSTQSGSQTTTLISSAAFEAIRNEASGELPLVDFRNISTRFTGFTPSKGGDQIAEYIAGRARENGLSDVRVEGFPSDGSTWYWAFLGEPAWDAEAGG